MFARKIRILVELRTAIILVPRPNFRKFRLTFFGIQKRVIGFKFLNAMVETRYCLWAYLSSIPLLWVRCGAVVVLPLCDCFCLMGDCRWVLDLGIRASICRSYVQYAAPLCGMLLNSGGDGGAQELKDRWWLNFRRLVR